ncbi:MAG TPA: hypothetical protein PLX35_05510 [Cyclobacteriaceae bacterium]|nr:hypothetical protein [Cyclobacteriaceae bacterium]
MKLLIWLIFLLPHPIHVSVTEIEYSEKNKSLQITSRIFIDDLETAIRTKTKQESLDLLNLPSGQSLDQLVRTYLADHLRIKVDGRPAKINYIAHELDDAAIICYLEVENIKKLKTLEVTDDVIHEVHADQYNLVHITYRSPVKSYRLTREKPTELYRAENK